MNNVLTGGLCFLSKSIDLLSDNIRKVFLNYLLPSVGGMLGISLYVLGDTLLVGRGLGSSGLAALNLSIPIMNIFSGFGFMFGVGGATIVSILRGQKEDEKTHSIFSLSFLIVFILGIVISVLGLVYLEEFALFMGASNQKILRMSMDYLKPMFTASLFFLLNSFFIIFLRNDHAPRLVMIAMLTSSISNVILDYVFIFILDMGMFGAGLATALSPLISLLILSSHFILDKNTIRFTFFKFKFTTLRHIMLNGIPSFIIEAMAGLVIFVFNLAILRIEGDLGVSAYSIVANLSLFCAAVFNGIGQAIQPLVSLNYGAKHIGRVKELVRLAVFTSLGVGITFFSLGYFFPRHLTLIFINNPSTKLMALSIRGIRLYFISFLLMGLNTVLISYLQAMEYSKYSISLSIARGLVFVLTGIIILPFFFGMNGVWLTIPLAELLTVFLAIVLFQPVRKVLVFSFAKNH